MNNIKTVDRRILEALKSPAFGQLPLTSYEDKEVYEQQKLICPQSIQF